MPARATAVPWQYLIRRTGFTHPAARASRHTGACRCRIAVAPGTRRRI